MIWKSQNATYKDKLISKSFFDFSVCAAAVQGLWRDLKGSNI